MLQVIVFTLAGALISFLIWPSPYTLQFTTSSGLECPDDATQCFRSIVYEPRVSTYFQQPIDWLPNSVGLNSADDYCRSTKQCMASSLSIPLSIASGAALGVVAASISLTLKKLSAKKT